MVLTSCVSMPQGVETIVLTLPLGSEAVECASQQILKPVVVGP
jgi:hypothetical protein